MVLSEFLKEIRTITAVTRKTHGEQVPKREVAIEKVKQGSQSQGNTTPIHSEEDDGDLNYPDGWHTDFDDRDVGGQCFLLYLGQPPDVSIQRGYPDRV